MNLEAYLEDLTAQLQRRGVSGDHIGQVVEMVEKQLTESGESPVDAFGSATR